MKNKNLLLNLGYVKSDIMWSFTPDFSEQSGGVCYKKYFDTENENRNLDTLEVCVLLNDKYNSMEVYACTCTVGCCGNDLGIHEFSLEKLDELIKEQILFYK